MSVRVMTAVFDRYPNGGGEMLTALALADHASDDGTRVFPGIKALAEKTRQSERTIQYQLRRMEESGWLILVNAGNGGRSMTNEYRISLDWIKGADIAPIQKGANDDTKGATGDTKGCNPEQKRVQPVAPANNHHRTISEPSLNRPAADAPAKPGRGSVVPADFTPNQTAIDIAASTGVNLQAELANFLDHHTARGTVFKDWQAGFRTWLRNAVKFGQRAPIKRPSAHTGLATRNYSEGVNADGTFA